MNNETRTMITKKVKLYGLQIALSLALGVVLLAGLSFINPQFAPLSQPREVAAAPNNPRAETVENTSLVANLTIDLCAKVGSVSMPDGESVTIWGLAVGDCNMAGPAQLPGPVLAVEEGGSVNITLYNSLTEPVALSFPGQAVPADTTGAAPGGSATYSFTAGEPGTHLYEAGLNAAVQVPMGIYGAFVVQAATVNYDQEEVLVLSEIDPALNADPANFNRLDYVPKYWLINGKAYPDTAVITADPDSTLLLRYLNAGSIHHTMTLLGAHQQVVATDGYDLNYGYDVVAITVASGQTADTRLTIPSDAGGSQMPLYNRQLHLTNGLPGAGHYLPGGGMMTFIEVQEGLNFNDYTLSGYGGSQDAGGTATIADNGSTLQLAGNTWKRIDFPYNVTPHTVMEFDFMSSAETEIHAIGFDTDDTINNPIQGFQLYGTQSWGFGTYNDYAGSAPGWKHYTVYVGQFYSGAMNYLFFANDNDAGPIGESLFRNVQVYEQPLLQVDGTGYLVQDYGGAQNVPGSAIATIAGGGSETLHIVGNGWRKLALAYNVTASTVLEFDFSSTAEGDIHGIGLDTVDTAVNPAQTFQLYGTQTWGIQDYNTYTNGDGTVHVTIPVGTFFTGNMLYVTFANDHDVASPNAESLFSNISLHD
ncbi:MAG: multicopper oxidase family protein [Ardenticatenaceae bacterium]|nr:multicopper oxidase family protein [Ardenticatenaceae bacterium]